MEASNINFSFWSSAAEAAACKYRFVSPPYRIRPEAEKEVACSGYYAAERREWCHVTELRGDVEGVDEARVLFKVCRSLALRVLRCCTPMLERERRRDASVIDFFRYYASAEEGAPAMGLHTDPGLLTVATADAPGLQVAKRGRSFFEDAHARPSLGEAAFVVFAGDSLEARTRGAFGAVAHRVVACGSSSPDASRLASVFELRRQPEGDVEVDVEPAPGSAPGGGSREPPPGDAGP